MWLCGVRLRIGKGLHGCVTGRLVTGRLNPCRTQYSSLLRAMCRQYKDQPLLPVDNRSFVSFLQSLLVQLLSSLRVPVTSATPMAPKSVKVLFFLAIFAAAVGTGSAGPLAYGICQTGCNALAVSCYTAAGFTFGTVTAGKR